MTRLTVSNMAIDPRDTYDKLSRGEVRKILKARDIPFDPHIKKIEGVKLLQANQINPMDDIEWEVVTYQGADGKQGTKLEPKRTQPLRPEGHDERALAKLDELSAAAIKADENKIEDLEKQIRNLNELVTTLLGERQVENMKAAKIEDVVVKTTDLNKIHWKTFQKMAKGIGEIWSTKDPRAPIIEKLGELNG